MFNTMLRGHSISPDPENSLLLFNRVRAENRSFDFDQFTFISVLKSCTNLLEIRAGIGVHTDVLKSRFGSVLNVMNALLHFYCVCGMIEDVRQVFDELRLRKDLVSWNTLMGGVSLREGIFFVVGHLLNESLGETIHVFCFKLGFLSNLNVVAALNENDIKRDVVLWNYLIDGYARNGLLEEAMELLRLIKDHGVRPNSSMVAGFLSACSTSGALGISEYVRGYVEEEQLPMDAVLGTAIVDMYAKSGLLEKVVDVFNQLEIKDVKSWTAMISGCGVHGQANHAPWRLDERRVELFREDGECLSVKTKIEHYGCMIDLLGRAGLLEEAYELIKGLLVERDATAWRALLGACRMYGNVKLAKRVKEELEGICENHVADSLSLVGAYVAAGMVADQR
ncbi:hypothetical protein SASPL_114985 [Salvia splendens]|uniref:Pentatricopeptide repeat-containing protein n=1 Tax=Salvia splendens TaxID=180675 RepID=A0A8X8Y5S0_SALSN|nr:hypothetical protein SASPL_114985 [Salvia splendens]